MSSNDGDRPAPDAALWLRGLTRRFGGVTAVSGVNLEVRPGSRHGIIGPNGAGKTTLFNLISGELAPTAGTVHIFGEDATRMSPPRRVALGLGRTYQITRTFNALTVRQNLALGAFGLQRAKFSMLRSWTAFGEQMQRAEATAERFNLTPRLDSRASDLSHGELRQLEVALALTLEPRLLLLDEPGAGLSPGERLSMTKVLRELPGALTVLLIEHDMDMVRDLVERVTVLHYGEVVAEGSSAEVQAHPRVREIYLGTRG